MKNLSLATILVFFIGCQPSQEAQKPLEIDNDFQEIEDAYYVYAIGDWGRNGAFGQAELAEAMGKAAVKVEPEFIISTGDNFYPNGVASTQDPLWKSSFEEIYKAHSLYCDWFVTPGNHDYRGNVQAEIDYTNVSRRWNMPSRYFHKDVLTEGGASVRFVFADTSPLNDEYYSEEKYKDKVSGQDTTAQLQWIDSLLSDPFDWKIMVGHHPLYTGGKRAGEQNDVRNHLERLLDKHQVDLYLAGHEHDLQHIKPPGHPTHHFISGAGSEVRPTGKLGPSLFAASIQGFLSMAITPDSAVCTFINLKGEIIYETSIQK